MHGNVRVVVHLVRLEDFVAFASRLGPEADFDAGVLTYGGCAAGVYCVVGVVVVVAGAGGRVEAEGRGEGGGG